MFVLLPAAIRNLWRRNLRRTILTVLAVATATVVFCAVAEIPYVIAAITRLENQSPRVVVTNEASMRYPIPESYAQKVAALPGVVAVNRMVWYAGIYDDPKHQFPTLAIDPENIAVIWPEYGLGADEIATINSEKDGALVGVTSMHRFHWKIGQLITLRSQILPVSLTFKIVGTYAKGPDLSAVMFRRDYLEDALHDPGIVDMMWVKCASIASTSRVAAAIDDLFHNSEAQTQSATEKDFMVNAISQFNAVVWILESVGACAVAAIILVVLNATAMNVRERRGELATMRALGFTRDQILFAIAVEAGLLALMGGIVGTLIAKGALSWARGHVPALGMLLEFGLPTPVMFGGLAVALAIGLLAALGPALGAIRIGIAEAFRKVN